MAELAWHEQGCCLTGHVRMVCCGRFCDSLVGCGHVCMYVAVKTWSCLPWT